MKTGPVKFTAIAVDLFIQGIINLKLQKTFGSTLFPLSHFSAAEQLVSLNYETGQGD